MKQGELVAAPCKKQM